MVKLPCIETERLRLRPFNLDDAKEVQRLAGDIEIAKTTLHIPIPMKMEWQKNGLAINKEHDRAELGYWVGRPYWNKGYCSEAAKALCDYGFQKIGLNKICAAHLKRNPASGKVMQKIGMEQEGVFKEHVKKWGKYEDLVYYGMLLK